MMVNLCPVQSEQEISKLMYVPNRSVFKYVRSSVPTNSSSEAVLYCTCSWQLPILSRDLAPKDPNGYADSYAKLVFKDQKSSTKVSRLMDVREHYRHTLSLSP